MIKLTYSFLLLFTVSFFYNSVNAEEKNTEEKHITTINLKYITGKDIISVLKSLVDESVSISEKNNVLIISGSDKKTKNILPIISKIDTPPAALTIEFIASNRKVNFKTSSNTYQTNKNKTTQSMAIIERQWVTLNTGLSIPIFERKRYADGTEIQSYKYKKISKSYVFKVHEFSGWSVIQVGLNVSSLSNDVAGAIEHTNLDTTIIGKTGEWLEVAASKRISEDKSSKIYSTNKPNKNQIYLYVKVIKPKIETESKNTIIK